MLILLFSLWNSLVDVETQKRNPQLLKKLKAYRVKLARICIFVDK